MTSAERVAVYLWSQLHRRNGDAWLSGPRHRGAEVSKSSDSTVVITPPKFTLTPAQRRKLSGVENITQLFQRFFFKGVVLDSHEGMVAWLEGRYPLELRYDIPSPQEMLEAQVEGLRFVTLMPEPEQQLLNYGRHKDACAFTLHDLEHAHKFYGDANSCRGQICFFRGLKVALPLFVPWSSDSVFERDLNYLMSDMNSHPVHLVKFLKAIVLSAEVRRTGDPRPDLSQVFSELFSAWEMRAETLDCALRINHPEVETSMDQSKIAEFFMHSHSFAEDFRGIV